MILLKYTLLDNTHDFLVSTLTAEIEVLLRIRTELMKSEVISYIPNLREWAEKCDKSTVRVIL